jgi:hypothetical protein
MPLADNMHGLDIERIGRSHNRTYIDIVLPILDSNLQSRSMCVQIIPDSLDSPIAIPIKHVAPITMSKQLRIIPITNWPW